MSRSKNRKNIEIELQKSFDQWESQFENGCRDPIWSDGMNLNLVRNHIKYYKAQIEESYEPDKYPAIFRKQTPPKVPQDYMARADEIRKNAKHSITLYEQDESYHYLLKKVNHIDPKEGKRLCVRNVINYTKGLGDAIASDDLVTMRRHENPDYYLSAFEECARQVRELKPPENEQLSFFSLTLDDVDEELFYEDDEEQLDEEENSISMQF